jgi:hypothetical protein
MPGKRSGFSKPKNLFPVGFRHLPPVVHDGYVNTLDTKDKLHGEV